MDGHGGNGLAELQGQFGFFRAANRADRSGGAGKGYLGGIPDIQAVADVAFRQLRIEPEPGQELGRGGALVIYVRFLQLKVEGAGEEFAEEGHFLVIDGQEIHGVIHSIPDNADALGRGQGAGHEAQLDLRFDFRLALPVDELLALLFVTGLFFLHGYRQLLFEQGRRDFAQVDAQGKGQVGAADVRGGRVPFGIGKVSPGAPAERAFLRGIVNGQEGVFLQQGRGVHVGQHKAACGVGDDAQFGDVQGGCGKHRATPSGGVSCS